MKKHTVILVGLFAILLFVSILLFCPNSHATRLQLYGTVGTHFTGFYIQNGQRIAVAATLPWSLQHAGITQFEFRKTDLKGDFAFEVRRDGFPGLIGQFCISGGAGQEVIGLHGCLDPWSINIHGICQGAQCNADASADSTNSFLHGIFIFRKQLNTQT